MGYVYLLLELDKNGDERHKIGFSKNHPDKRVKQLSTGNSNKITLLSYYVTDNYKKVEKWLHGDFLGKKTEAQNEWFNLSNQDVLGFIDKCKKADEIITILKQDNPFYK